PIIMPLSNPTSKCEAMPEDLIKWSQGKAIVATGSPFEPVEYNGESYNIAQCNNAYIFPGIGLGISAIRAKHISDKVFMAASKALASCSPRVKGEGPELLPALTEIHEVSKIIAVAVAKQAIAEGVALPVPEDILPVIIEDNFWLPEYRKYKRTSL
ncbi:MAG: NAD-dependent malic enzyme, partial [Enterobacterales bacterium]|nr:NAD-dependent malic enzyme [Enterobacterales bacterium]